MSSIGVLNNNQLKNLAAKHDLPLIAVLMSGDIPNNLIPHNGFYIFNMDRHPNGKGTHWVCAYCRYPNCIYFDSFGYPPNIPIENFLSRGFPSRSILWNNKEIQDYNSDNCGDWCLALAINIKRSINQDGLINAASSFLDQFTRDTKHNEQMLVNMNI